MTDQESTSHSALPHHKLVAYRVAVELLLAVKAANVRDAKLRDEATRAAKSACLNAAAGRRPRHTGRQGPRLRHRARRSQRSRYAC